MDMHICVCCSLNPVSGRRAALNAALLILASNHYGLICRKETRLPKANGCDRFKQRRQGFRNLLSNGNEQIVQIIQRRFWLIFGRFNFIRLHCWLCCRFGCLLRVSRVRCLRLRRDNRFNSWHGHMIFACIRLYRWLGDLILRDRAIIRCVVFFGDDYRCLGGSLFDFNQALVNRHC